MNGKRAKQLRKKCRELADPKEQDVWYKALKKGYTHADPSYMLKAAMQTGMALRKEE
jgi:hypothetical protein